MKSFKHFSFLILLLIFQTTTSQSVEMYGKVESSVSVENIHVINKTAQAFATTNKKGEFKITVKLNDTLIFSSIQHIPKKIIVGEKLVLNQAVTIKLEEQINELDEVLVGKILTGDLLSDVENADDDAPINFYDVGISGYTGKIATQSERRLHEAGEFKPKMLLGLLGGGLPLDPILNGISGRTKQLKERVRLEANDELLQKIKTSLSKDFFSVYELDESLRVDFFYFCQEDENFTNTCTNKSDIEIVEFLKEKLVAYKNNLKTTND
ncbi:carboxypeptidase-like regulatory domain-containing protein [Sabulilitoribacter arenilitoris]|uniref:Carboxypeptidase-like regulatory domain-containing protein n=1 Tax=Wocania arenilitoris TaxID=2044858 RepID=A0AAE3JLZ0_9FLAO|nr:carboxypeptidase-like regulatory domain-containing protein [Wocania arenilitoris]MCF7567246.1 carboxypeptidase-like regulatory domain-containing protein [Wocania arenilitoris]